MIDKLFAQDMLRQVARRLQTQDNRITSTPLYCVMETVEVFTDEDGENRFTYDKVVTTCLTLAGAEGYIKNHSHAHRGRLSIYVDSGHRNAELKLLRECLCVVYGDTDEKGEPLPPTGR